MKIVHFADLHLGVETYGRIDPTDGLPTRLKDFLAALDQLVDYSIENKVDLVVFCGDAYKTREPNQTQQREFARRINRLSIADIPVFLLIGNHDLPNAIGRATATEIFDTLTVKNVYVAARPGVQTIDTASGPIQVAGLPWLRRSALISRENTRNLNLEQLNERLQQILTDTVTSLADKIDSSIPAVLAAHAWITGARVGSESSMSIGQDPTLLISSVGLPAFDYVALGHIHKHQVLNENPPVVYAGSLERVDFGEEGDDKGFYVVDIETDAASGWRKVSFAFHPVETRRFQTIDAKLDGNELDPTATVLAAISARRETIKDAIVRLNISLPSSLEKQLRDNEIREALKEACYFTITREISRETRLRMGNRTAEEVNPGEALRLYLETQNLPDERRRLLLEYGQKLINRED